MEDHHNLIHYNQFPSKVSVDLYRGDHHAHVDEHELTHEVEFLDKYQYQVDYEFQSKNNVVLNHSPQQSTNHRLPPAEDLDDGRRHLICTCEGVCL